MQFSLRWARVRLNGAPGFVPPTVNHMEICIAAALFQYVTPAIEYIYPQHCADKPAPAIVGISSAATVPAIWA